MRKICNLICALCLFICFVFVISPTVNAVELSDYDKMSEFYKKEIEERHEINNYYEALASRIEPEWLVEDENGKMYWNISKEKINSLDAELVEFLNNSIEEKNRLIDDGYIEQVDGDIKISEEIENDYYIQSGEIEIVQRFTKVWFVTIWIGFEIVCNNPVPAIVLSSIGILLDLIGIIKDISIIWRQTDVAVNIAMTYCYSLHKVIAELGSLLSKIPSYILTGVEIMWKGLVVGSTGVFGIILSLLKLGFPKTLQAFDIIRHASNGGGVVLTYTVVVFSGYRLI